MKRFSSKTYKSGAQKRKEAKAKQDIVTKSRKITDFASLSTSVIGKKNVSAQELAPTETEEPVQSIPDLVVSAEEEVVDETSGSSFMDIATVDEKAEFKKNNF